MYYVATKSIDFVYESTKVGLSFFWDALYVDVVVIQGMLFVYSIEML